MSKVLPSDVVAAIVDSYPGLSENIKLDAGNAGRVSGILELYERVTEEHFTALASKDFTLLMRAMAEIRAAVAWWRNTDYSTYKTSGGPQLGRSEALGGKHPLQVMKALLEKCPDEAPGVTAPGLAFLGDPDLEADLRQDVTTAYTTLANGEFKPASVIAGSVIESLLLWAVKRKAADIPTAIAACQAVGEDVPPVAKAADPDRWDLSHLLNVGQRIPVVSNETFKACDNAREVRNLIHPGRVLRLQKPATKGRAMLAVGAMEQVLDDLAARVAAGTL